MASTSDPQGRSLAFASRRGNRYWWFQRPRNRYVPPVLAFLSDGEWALLERWYDETDRSFSSTGECNVPTISLLQGLVMGSGIRNILQIGHYIGYSTLLLGFMVRRMGFRQSVISVDIDPQSSAYTKEWLARAGLDDFVRVVVSDSVAPELPAAVREHLGCPPDLVFIDSSHAYRHTLRELDLWYAALSPGGIMVLHDASEFATAFDDAGEGGVRRAVDEWLPGSGAGARAIMLNRDFGASMDADRLVYGDPCGTAIIQKPFA